MKVCLSSVNARLEDRLVARTQDKAFLVFLPSLLQDELLFIGGHAEAHQPLRFSIVVSILYLYGRDAGGHLKVGER